MSIVKHLKSVLEEIKSSGNIEVVSKFNLTDREKELVCNLYEEGLIDQSLKYIDELDVDQEWEIVKAKMLKEDRSKILFWKPLLKYAAIFIGLFALTYFFDFRDNSVIDNSVVPEAITLKIGKDNVKLIKQGENQQIVSSTGEILGVQEGNKIRYNTNSQIKELVYNELEVPYGKIFDVELSDGTLVHLNSGTKFRYPISFLEGQKREVFVEGEAYFKVTKDESHPFVVNAEAVAVEVLGTEFNISSYKVDSEINTVLVEGSVRMTNIFAPEDNIILKPGYKGAWNKKDRSTDVREVDINLYTGWIKGELIFRRSSFADMVKKLERRYNVAIENNNMQLSNMVFNASFSVEIESIDEVMKSISEIYPFDYKIINKEIIIN